MLVDIHCHVGLRCEPCRADERFSFESTNEYAPYDAYFSDRVKGGIPMRIAQWYFKVPRGVSDIQKDEFSRRLLLEHILGASLVDRAVVLGLDQYHATSGEALGQRRCGVRFGTDMYVSNTFVRGLWREHPRRILFGASIHPYRRAGNITAVDMLEEVAEAGAVLIKWLPLTQNINAEDPRSMAFLRRAAELGMPMLIHCGPEGTLGNMHPGYADPSGLLRTLRELRGEGKMPTVIVAHVATPLMWPVASGRFHRTLIDAMLGEFADAPLYADISALTLFSKARWLKRLIRRKALHHKLVHGSDFPVPPVPLAFWLRLSKCKYRQICDMPSWLDRDVALKSALGLGEEVMHRGGALLADRIAAADAIINSV